MSANNNEDMLMNAKISTNNLDLGKENQYGWFIFFYDFLTKKSLIINGTCICFKKERHSYFKRCQEKTYLRGNELRTYGMFFPRKN